MSDEQILDWQTQMFFTKRKLNISNATEDKDYEEGRRPLNVSIILNVIKLLQESLAARRVPVSILVLPLTSFVISGTSNDLS